MKDYDCVHTILQEFRSRMKTPGHGTSSLDALRRDYYRIYHKVPEGVALSQQDVNLWASRAITNSDLLRQGFQSITISERVEGSTHTNPRG